MRDDDAPAGLDRIEFALTNGAIRRRVLRAAERLALKVVHGENGEFTVYIATPLDAYRFGLEWGTKRHGG